LTSDSNITLEKDEFRCFQIVSPKGFLTFYSNYESICLNRYRRTKWYKASLIDFEHFVFLLDFWRDILPQTQKGQKRQENLFEVLSPLRTWFTTYHTFIFYKMFSSAQHWRMRWATTHLSQAQCLGRPNIIVIFLFWPFFSFLLFPHFGFCKIKSGNILKLCYFLRGNCEKGRSLKILCKTPKGDFMREESTKHGWLHFAFCF